MHSAFEYKPDPNVSDISPLKTFFRCILLIASLLDDRYVQKTMDEN